MKKNYYAIRKGKKNNVIVESWNECRKLVDGVSGAIFKGFVYLEEAEKFAKSGDYGEWTPKPKKDIKKPAQNKPWGKCLQRKSYTDPFTGQFYKNRCVLKFIATTTGKDYFDEGDNSIPWDIAV